MAAMRAVISSTRASRTAFVTLVPPAIVSVYSYVLRLMNEA